MSDELKFSYLGLVSYEDAVNQQLQLSDELRASQHVGHVLGLQHKPVITLGRRFKNSSKAEQEIFNSDGYDVQISDRGGEATLHHPGQIVIYPVVNLRLLSLTPRDYICLLLKVTQSSLLQFGVATESSLERPGIYTPTGKIGFVGVRIDRGITRHGVSININNDIKEFDRIRSCGVENSKMDRLSNYSDSVSEPAFFKLWSGEFRKHLKRDQQTVCKA